MAVVGRWPKRLFLLTCPVAAALASPSFGESSPSPSQLAACSSLDMHVFGLIEENGQEDVAPGHDIFVAYLQMLEARALCRSNPQEGIRRYEMIDMDRLHPIFRRIGVSSAQHR